MSRGSVGTENGTPSDLHYTDQETAPVVHDPWLAFVGRQLGGAQLGSTR